MRGRPVAVRRARRACADGDEPAPPRRLGGYDNLWPAHEDRAHVMDDEARRRWAGVNAGTGNALFVDGFMSGLWSWRRARVDLETSRPLSRTAWADLAEEVARTEAFLAG